MIDFGFDDEMIRRFTLGDCWILANYLYELGSFDAMVGSYDPDDWNNWGHCAVGTSGGLIVDIRGVQTPDEFHDYWNLYPLVGSYPFESEGQFDNWEELDDAEEVAYDTAKDIYSKLKRLSKEEGLLL